MASGRKRKNSGSRGGKVAIAVVVIAFLIAMGVWTMKLAQKRASYKERKAELEQQYEEETERASELADQEEYMQSTEYIEDTAEDKLGLSKDGQIIFKETESDDE